MDNMKKSIRRVFWIHFLLFFTIVLYLFKFAVSDSQKIVVNSYNPRLTKINNHILRGDILDSKGTVLASTEIVKGAFKRKYYFGRQFSHVIGYTGIGKSGIEAYLNFELQKIHHEILNRASSLFTGADLKGNSVILTIDKDLQQFVYEKLGSRKGAIVVMEPQTGRIMSMVSFPNFNPNEVMSDWKKLSNDERSPLLNRATQGLYPPGSVFKIVTAVSEIENYKNWKNFIYSCNGEDKIGADTIRCFNNKKHGFVDFNKAMAVSCNTYFSTVGTLVGAKNLRSTSLNLLFNHPLDFPIDYSSSSFALDEHSSEAELIETAIGQGKTLVTPIHMAMIVSSVANGGLMMKPYLIDAIKTPSGEEIKKHIPEKEKFVFSSETAEAIRKSMIEVVESGTATKAKIKGVSVAGKTGTAQNASGEDHAWFVGFAPAENPTVAVAIVLENAGNGSQAVPIARDIINFVLKE